MIVGSLVHGIAFDRRDAAAREAVKPWFESGAASAGKDAGRR
jgi:hypothetical protein